MSKAPEMSKANAYQFNFKSIDGKDMPLAGYKGKVILVVNTASHCGFTPQYAGLQKLYDAYKDKGLVVLGVPSSDFGGQEFDSEDEVDAFTEKNFSITFPMTEITKVKGKEPHPFYQWVNVEAGVLGRPKWNFHKFLIDKNGNFAGWYSSLTKPMSSGLTQKIDALLEKTSEG